MKKQVLQSLGFQEINRTSAAKKAQEKETQVSNAFVKKEGSQLRITIPRSVMRKMKWEISNRIKVMVNEENGMVALIRAQANEKNSYAIGFQSATKDVAIENGHPGVIRVSTEAFSSFNGKGGIFAPLIHDRSTIIMNMQAA